MSRWRKHDKHPDPTAMRGMMDTHDSNTPPANWKRCSPELLESGVDCATAPRWSAGPIGEHWHPSAGGEALLAYQVGDNDIVAAHTPEEAIAVLCDVTGEPLTEYNLNEVELVGDKHLDSLEAFNQDEGTIEKLETSLRQDVTNLTEPTYLYGWE